MREVFDQKQHYNFEIMTDLSSTPLITNILSDLVLSHFHNTYKFNSVFYIIYVVCFCSVFRYMNVGVYEVTVETATKIGTCTSSWATFVES